LAQSRLRVVAARLLIRERVSFSDCAFAEFVVRELTQPLAGSIHPYKYRLAYVVDGVCILRYDNEAGKGDHQHVGRIETRYEFVSVRHLMADFRHHIARLLREDRDP
jgi:hypothetical protein